MPSLLEPEVASCCICFVAVGGNQVARYTERLGIVEAVRNLESSGSGVHHLPSEHRLADNILQ